MTPESRRLRRRCRRTFDLPLQRQPARPRVGLHQARSPRAGFRWRTLSRRLRQAQCGGPSRPRPQSARRHSARCCRRRAVRSQQQPREGARGRKIKPRDFCMRGRRAQDHAFKLPVMADVDRIARRTRHLVARLYPRRDGHCRRRNVRHRLPQPRERCSHRRRSGRDVPTVRRRFPRATASPRAWPRASSRETRRLPR